MTQLDQSVSQGSSDDTCKHGQRRQRQQRCVSIDQIAEPHLPTETSFFLTTATVRKWQAPYREPIYETVNSLFRCPDSWRMTDSHDFHFSKEAYKPQGWTPWDMKRVPTLTHPSTHIMGALQLDGPFLLTFPTSLELHMPSLEFLSSPPHPLCSR